MKVADLTIGDLAGLTSPKKRPEAEEEPTPGTVKPFKRRL